MPGSVTFRTGLFNLGFHPRRPATGSRAEGQRWSDAKPMEALGHSSEEPMIEEEPVALEARIIGIVEIVQPQHLVPGVERELCGAATDEACGAGDEEEHLGR